MKFFKSAVNTLMTQLDKKIVQKIGFAFAATMFSTCAMAAINLPMGTFFCEIASALQSQWAPGIIMIMIIVEGFLFMVVKKGVLQMLMVTVIAATIIFSAAKFLNMIQPNSGCAATASISFNMHAA
jgi:type IV secretory pathway VirB2 component (pilin)